MVDSFSASYRWFGFVHLYTEFSAGHLVDNEIEVALRSFAVFATGLKFPVSSRGGFYSIFAVLKMSSMNRYWLSKSPSLTFCCCGEFL